MLSILGRFGYGADHLKTILEPATANVVASRMAGNMAKFCMRDQHGTAEEVAANGAYWTAVRRLFELRVRQSDHFTRHV